MAKKPKVPFGKLVAQVRKARNFEQASFAKLVGMPQSSLSLLEVGRFAPAHELGMKIINSLTTIEAERQEMIDALEYLDKNFEERVKYPTFMEALNTIMTRLSLQYAPLMRGMFDQSMAQHLKEGIRLPSPAKLKELVKRLKKEGATSEELLDLERAYIYDSIVEHSRFELIPLSVRKEMAQAAADSFNK